MLSLYTSWHECSARIIYIVLDLFNNMTDRFFLHYTQKHPFWDWRLRCLKKHPLDPGWEVGTYTSCHPKYRHKHEPGDFIFDVVTKDDKAVIRSAFRLSDVQGKGKKTVLLFDDYYFADEEPFVLLGDRIQYRNMYLKTYMQKFSMESPLEFIKNNYGHYKKGEKPISISQESWDKLIQTRKRHKKSKSE